MCAWTSRGTAWDRPPRGYRGGRRDCSTSVDLDPESAPSSEAATTGAALDTDSFRFRTRQPFLPLFPPKDATSGQPWREYPGRAGSCAFHRIDGLEEWFGLRH